MYTYTNLGNSKCDDLSLAVGLGAYPDNFANG